MFSNGSVRVSYASGMGLSFHMEPHVVAGPLGSSVGRRNISLPTDSGLNALEWRTRKELVQNKVTVFGRKLRVRLGEGGRMGSGKGGRGLEGEVGVWMDGWRDGMERYID